VPAQTAAVPASTPADVEGPVPADTDLPADVVCAVDASVNDPSAKHPSTNDLVLPVRTQPEPRLPLPSRKASQTESATVNRSPLLVPTELGDVWSGLAQALCQQGVINGLARELLLQGQLMEQQAPQENGASALWTLRVERESVNHEPSRKRLEQAVAAHTGQPVRFQIEYGRVVDCPALRTAAMRVQQQQQAEEAFGSHPFVQAMMHEFDARALPGSVGYAEEPPAAPAGK
jgi:DNA polymerase-3 subunit gamma/tau